MTIETSVQGGLVIEHWPLVQAIPATPSEIARFRIETMEREQLMPRATREFMLTFMEAQALEMGVTQETLMAKNALYRRVKQFEDQITALRAQL